MLVFFTNLVKFKNVWLKQFKMFDLLKKTRIIFLLTDGAVQKETKIRGHGHNEHSWHLSSLADTLWQQYSSLFYSIVAKIWILLYSFYIFMI